MFQPVSLFIGFRYSRSKNRNGFISFITFFSTAGILLGVASLITVVSVMNGFEKDLKTRILGLVPHVTISTNSDQLSNWQPILKQLLLIPHVKSVSPQSEIEALIQSPNHLEGILVQGIMPEYEQQNIVQKSMVLGQLSSLTANKYTIIIGSALANKINVSVGDNIRLVVPNGSIFTPFGQVPLQRKFTVSGIFNVGSQVDDSVVYIHSTNSAKLLRQRGDGVSQLRLYLDDAFHAALVAKFIKTQPFYSKYQLKLSTWETREGALFSAVKMEKNMMWLMLSLIIAVATFNIISALAMVVMEKQSEIAILQTLGLNRLSVIKIFIVQGMTNGLWGTILGAGLGILLTANINHLIEFFGVNLFGASYGIQQLPTFLRWQDVTTIIISALLMTFMATLYPAFRAAKTQPAEVLRND